ncbi:hypothetical protein [Burkholderia sp. LMG 32019]|uniref:hypothetical protein n=1 Tax=Burkholderia sp. LMG 32019 TaxID=3158173 RepID=UPI003C2D7FD1
MTVKRSLDSENAGVLRVRCAAGDDIGISSITLICAEIVMENAQTRQDAAPSHFYAGEFGRAVPVRPCAHGMSASVLAWLQRQHKRIRCRPPPAPCSGCACNECRVPMPVDRRRDVTATANLPAFAIGATRSKGRFYNRRHLPLALRLPG